MLFDGKAVFGVRRLAAAFECQSTLSTMMAD